MFSYVILVDLSTVQHSSHSFLLEILSSLAFQNTSLCWLSSYHIDYFFSGTCSCSLNIEVSQCPVLGCLLLPLSTSTPLVISSSLVGLYTYQRWQRWYSPNTLCSLLLYMLLGCQMCVVLVKGNMRRFMAIKRKYQHLWQWKSKSLLEEIQVIFGGKPLRRTTCFSLDCYMNKK